MAKYIIYYTNVFGYPRAIPCDTKDELRTMIERMTDIHEDDYRPLEKLSVYQLPVPAADLEKLP